MITITIPPSFINERTYAVDILLREILGLEIQIIIGKSPDYRLSLPNRKEVLIKDHFFSSIPADTTYLSSKYLPAQISFTRNQFSADTHLPVIYGNPKIEVTDKRITSHIDIFSAAFFMLSRWEEYVSTEQDIHQRFPAVASIAFKNNFLDQPVVNQYAEMLRQMLSRLGYKHQHLSPFHFILTHDIDALFKWLGPHKVLRSATADIVKRADFKQAAARITEYYYTLRGKSKDLFDTYDQLMDISEQRGLKSHFYFMSGGQSQYDRRTPYNILSSKARALIAKIHQQGHIVGFHPSYDSYNNEHMLRAQRDRVQKACPPSLRISSGRQHYLRFQVPHTWQLWENLGMTLDSTCGFADREGFRCGTGNTFSVFNILTGKKLMLKEQPLIFMESRSFNSGGFDGGSDFNHTMPAIVAAAKQFHSPVTLLFHNDYAAMGYAQMYRDVLNLDGSGK